MSLVPINGMPIIAVGSANRQGIPSLVSLANTVVMDAVNEAVIMAGHLFWTDSSSHTVNTTGSSSIQWRSSSATFANALTTFNVGIADVDLTTGPPVRAANSSDVVIFDVAAVFTGGGGGVTANAWQTSVPTTGTKTISHGALIAVAMQMTARGGTDSVLAAFSPTIATTLRPSVTSFTGGTYSNSSSLPNVVVVASDGTIGYLYGGVVATVGATSVNWNNGSATKEYGNILRFPFSVRAYGISVATDFAGDCDLVLYSNPLGTPVAERTVSVDLNSISISSTTSDGRFLFTSPIELAISTDYAVIAKPTSATSVTMSYKTYNNSSHQNAGLAGD